MVARISDEALGFIVTSPRSELIDLGAKFGLSVDETGRTDAHVLGGLVEILPAIGLGLVSWQSPLNDHRYRATLERRQIRNHNPYGISSGARLI